MRGQVETQINAAKRQKVDTMQQHTQHTYSVNHNPSIPQYNTNPPQYIPPTYPTHPPYIYNPNYYNPPPPPMTTPIPYTMYPNINRSIPVTQPTYIQPMIMPTTIHLV